MPGTAAKIRFLLSILFGLTFAACEPSKPATETLDHHVSVDLSAAWDNTPWSPEKDARGVPLPQPEDARLEARFVLPADFIGHGSVLQLEGLSWTADISVNGRKLPRATGGVGLTEVELGDGLREGENTIAIHITGAKDTAPLLVGHKQKAASLSTSPRLLLRPRVGLKQAMVNLTEEGLTVRATTRNAPEGTRVHFEGWRDGVRFADWGEAEVHNGTAIIHAREWTGANWPGEATSTGLFMLRATLLDSTGAALDSNAWRTGVRRFEQSNGRTYLNGKEHKMLGLRNHNAGLARGLELMAPAGLNLVEFHGDMPTQLELEMADELGVSLAILPRCDGRIQADLNQVKAASSALAIQDAAMMAQAANSPSVLIWSTEGSALNRKGYSVGRPLIANMLQDPVDRLVAAWDMPAFAIPITGPNHLLDEQRERAGISEDSAFWILEFHLTDPDQRPTVEALTETVKESFRIGAMGGVLPGAEEGNQEWAPSWAKHAAELGIPPLSTEGRRATARTEVRGVSAGEMVSIQAPGAPHTGAVAGQDGFVSLSLWHRGSATLQARNGTQTITLEPGSWRSAAWSGRTTQVNLERSP